MWTGDGYSNVLYRIRAIIGSNHKITKRPSRSSKWKDIYRIQIGSSRWFTDLTRLGFTQHKSNTLQFPEVPSEYVGDFVRGYFDGDGCVYFKKLKFADRKRKRFILLTLFTSGSRQFLESLWETLRQYDIRGGSLKKKTHGFELMFSHKDSLALYTLMYHTASTTDLYLPRKYKLFTKAVRTLYPNAVVA